MHKDWIQDALKQAPENIDDNMTIQEFVDAYSEFLNTFCNLGNSIGSVDVETLKSALERLKKSE